MKQPRKQYVYVVTVGFEYEPLSTHGVHKVFNDADKAYIECTKFNQLAKDRDSKAIYTYSKQEVYQ